MYSLCLCAKVCAFKGFIIWTSGQTLWTRKIRKILVLLSRRLFTVQMG